MTVYIAESLAAYSVIKDWPHHPNNDDGWNAVRPQTVATGPDEARVRHELALHLIKSSRDPILQKIFNAASQAIVDGVDAVQISGRVYRIRATDDKEWHVRKANGQYIGPFPDHAAALKACGRCSGTPVQLPKEG